MREVNFTRTGKKTERHAVLVSLHLEEMNKLQEMLLAEDQKTLDALEYCLTGIPIDVGIPVLCWCFRGSEPYVRLTFATTGKHPLA